MRRFALLLVTFSLVAGLATAASAEELVYATGRVFAADGRTPLSGAVVAVYDSKNRVVDYARTDERGEYALAIPRSALNLNGKGGQGFFRQVVGAVGGVGRIASLPLKAGIRAAASVATAADPITRVGIGAASGVAQGLVDQMSPRGSKRPALERNQPGVLVMKVTQPGHNDVVSLARVYWLEEQLYRAGGREQRSLTAWVDPARLTAAGDEKPSAITSNYLTFTEARIEPSIAEVGQTVTISAKLPAPPDPNTPVIVIARHCKSGRIYPLEPVGAGVYRGDVEVDKKFPKQDQVFCIVAYAEQDERPGRNKRAEDAIIGAGMLNAEKPYIYNPLLVVSRNRADVTLTVVEPSRRK
jgi:hypothetical protein